MRYLLLVSVFLLGGCATLIHGSSERVRVESEPDGAQVEVDGRPMGTTPTTLDLRRDQDHVVRVYHPEYAPHEVTLSQNRSLWTITNLLNLVVPGMLVDLSTGAFYTLEPDLISPTFDAPPSDPDSE